MDENRASNLRDIDILTGNPMSGGDVLSGVGNNGEPLFVINLCAAMTPIDLDSRGFAGLEQFKLYQVSRMEDGRRRYRLRLGFFTTEAHAEDVLSSVRSRYATAFTACLCEEDLKHATGYLKCSVQDLQRTGRYAVQKLRGDSGATTTVRALDGAALQQLQAAAVQATAVQTISPVIRLSAAPANVSAIRAGINTHHSREPIVEVSWQPEAQVRHKAPVAKPVAIAQSLPPKSLPTAATMSPPRAVSAAPALAPKVDVPKRASLMQRAHAMAPVDSADRAKAVPKISSMLEIHAEATGKFKVPTITPTIAPRPIALEASTPPVHTPKASIQKSNHAFHVGAGVHIPDTQLSLAPTPPKVVAQASASPTRVAPIVSPAIETSSTSDLLRARELAKQSTQWRQEQGEIPTLDTTQTIRTLTKNELEEANCPKWFTVQLAISDHPANLDTMPRLDIFEAYSLYSVAVMEGGGIRHALRLGFFREAVSAEAVMGYLKTFFHEPLIVRIPDAEHDRFANAPKIHPIAQPAANVITIEQKQSAKITPLASSVPTINTTVERTAAMVKYPPRGSAAQSAKPMARSAPPATKRAAHTQPVGMRKSATPLGKPAGRAMQKDLLDEARSLGLSDTAIIRVQKNPSLLARLVGKLGK